jgi:hypothetical protein
VGAGVVLGKQPDYSHRKPDRWLVERAGLKAELDVSRATDILWTINHPNTWQLLVVDRGWTPPQYEQWAGDLACTQLLRPRRATTRRRRATSEPKER